MPLHFAVEEYAQRRAAATEAMASEGLDGMLLFSGQSQYYLTGYDSFGFVLFQCLYLGADGRMTLLTRAADVPAAEYTSVLEDIRIWIDGTGQGPAEQLRDILEEHGCRGKRLGVEYESWGLTGRNAKRLDAALDGFCATVDASELVARIRLVKSEAELVYVRRAAALADEALSEANRMAVAGAFEGEILAAMQGAVFKGGGDYPGNEFTIGSGRGALLARYHSGRRHLDSVDQLTVQIGGVYRHYHASLMSTILVGEAHAQHRAMHAAMRESLEAAHEILKPGAPIRDIFEAYRKICERTGFTAHRLTSCGYSLGAAYHPTWMDWPWIHAGSEVVAAPNMVFYVHMILADRGSGRAMTLADTSVVTATGCERLSRRKLDLVVNAG